MGEPPFIVGGDYDERKIANPPGGGIRNEVA